MLVDFRTANHYSILGLVHQKFRVERTFDNFLTCAEEKLFGQCALLLCFKSTYMETVVTDDKTNRWSSAYMSLYASYFAVLLVAVRFNYRTVTNSCVFTGHFIQNILHFGTIQILYLFQMNYSYA